MIPGPVPAATEDNTERISRAVRALYEGGVGGPVSTSSTPVTDNAIVRWDGTDGRTVQGSLVTLDDSGNVSASGTLTVAQIITPSQPCFSANKNATDQTGIADNTFTKITFTTEEFDVGGFYDAANSKWTPPSGKNMIIGSVRLNSGVDQQIAFISIYKNGSRYRDIVAVTMSGASFAPATQGVAIDSANGSDFYELFFLTTGGGTHSVSGLVSGTYFQGFFLG